MKKIVRLIHHYAHAVEARSLMVSEYLFQKKSNKNFPKKLLLKILRSPSAYEDRINISRFLGVDEKILLVDVGGNTGYWAEDFVGFFKNTSIIAFEPDPEISEKYKRRFRGKNNCVVHPVALSSSQGVTVFNVAENSTFSTLENYSETQDERNIKLTNKIEVKKEKLDKFNIEVEGFDKAFIKVDVQGHEIEMLKGAIETLSKFDCALIELSFSNEYENIKPSFAEATSIMLAAGLYPIVFQDYGRTLSPYAWERDVIYVKESLLDKIWGW